MGQSVLRDRRVPFRNGGNVVTHARLLSKGNRVNIPEPGHGDWPFGVKCGDASELGDVGRSPGKSSLFFVRNVIPGIGLPGDRDLVSVKHRGSCGVWCTPVGP